MLCGEFRVPVNLGVIELKDASGLGCFHQHVVRPGKDFIVKRAELVIGTDIIDLVDNRAQMRVLVQYDLGDDALVGFISISQVQMC